MTYPPAAMKLATAARYCELSQAEFEREVAAGRLPPRQSVDEIRTRGPLWEIEG